MKKNISLIIGLAIPVVMVIVIGLSIYLPSLFNAPKYSFVYSIPQDYYDYGYSHYSVVDGKIIKTVPTAEQKKNMQSRQEILPDGSVRPITAIHEPKLYKYDTVRGVSSEISFEDAAKLKLDPSGKSPDQYEIRNGQGGGFFPFYEGGNYYDRYLVGHGTSKKIDLASDPIGYYQFTFVGWIIP